jgi:hypothetical protein
VAGVVVILLQVDPSQVDRVVHYRHLVGWVRQPAVLDEARVREQVLGVECLEEEVPRVVELVDLEKEKYRRGRSSLLLIV